MRMTIKNNGMLLIERNGIMTTQFCPFVTTDSKCGHWCPHFSEPQSNDTEMEKQKKAGKEFYIPTVTIKICHGKEITVMEHQFNDERKSK